MKHRLVCFWCLLVPLLHVFAHHVFVGAQQTQPRTSSVEDSAFANYVSELEDILSDTALLDVIAANGPWGSAQYEFIHKTHPGQAVKFQYRLLNFAGGWFNWNFLLRTTYWCRKLQRIGGNFRGNRWLEDGSYWMCLDNLADQGTIVYSLGSRDDTSFEQELISLKGNVEVYAFDCTDISPKNSSEQAELQGHFHKQQWCIDKSDYVLEPKPGDKVPFFLSVGQSYQYHSVSTVMSKLGHQTKDLLIFKIDTEGWEWNVLPNVLATDGFRPAHIILELHYARWIDGPAGEQNVVSIIQLFLLLAKSGYRLYAIDYVTYCCVNLSFIYMPLSS